MKGKRCGIWVSICIRGGCLWQPAEGAKATESHNDWPALRGTVRAELGAPIEELRLAARSAQHWAISDDAQRTRQVTGAYFRELAIVDESQIVHDLWVCRRAASVRERGCVLMAEEEEEADDGADQDQSDAYQPPTVGAPD